MTDTNKTEQEPCSGLSDLTVKLEREYIPKGGMCATCIWINANCSHLEFKTMPAIGTTAKGEIIVRCTAHLRSNG